MPPEVTEDDEGKPVFDGDGDRIGVVDEVREGTAYVDPDAEIDAELKSRLGWGRNAQRTYPLRHDAVEAVDEEAVRLRTEYE